MNADPYPETLSEIDDAALGFAPEPDPTVKALNRIATALEQLVLERVQPATHPNAVAAAERGHLATLPPVRTTAPQAPPQGVCPIHNVPWRTVPAGITKRGPRAGQPYDAFQACSVSGCDQRPPR